MTTSFARFAVRVARRQHGAAMTEYALAMIFTIPMLFYTIFLGDTLNISMKAQDGAAAAVWYGSGMAAHDYRTFNHDPKVAAAVKGGCDFVRTNWDAGLYGKGMAPFAASGRFANLTCTHHPGDGSVSEAAPASLNGLMNYNGLVSANMQVDVRNILVPRNTIFLQDTYDPSLDPLVFCGSGWATNRMCDLQQIGFYAWYDDWAVAMNKEMPRNQPDNNSEAFALIDNLFSNTNRGHGNLVSPIVQTVLGRGLLDDIDGTRVAYYAHPGVSGDTGTDYGAGGPSQTTHSPGKNYNTIHWVWGSDGEQGYVDLQRTRRSGIYYMGRNSVP